MAKSPEDVVRDFCAAWERLDVDEIAGYFTEDAVYHNIPVEPLRGRDAIRSALASFTRGWDGTEFELVNIASAGEVVLTERVDYIEGGGKRVGLPVAGVFVVEGEKIREWRDYFDMAMFTKAFDSGE